MSSTTFLVGPSIPTGHQRRVELAGNDLWIFARVDNVFVYPSSIDVDQFKDALARTLSLWPLVASRGRLEEGEHYFIEMSDHPLPLTVVHNDQLPEWPLDSNVVVEMTDCPLSGFIDEVQTMKSFDNVSDEPMVRLKLTHLVQSGEWVLGISWSHALGDAAAYLQFSCTISRFYQQLEAPEPPPIFERRLWRQDEVDPSFLPRMKQLRDAKPAQEMFQRFFANQLAYDPVTVHFSSDQLVRLRTLIDGDDITVHDALIAYILVTLNTACYNDEEKHRIRRTSTTVNFRGVSDSIAPAGQVANAIFMMVSDNVDDSCSLTSIAQTIRRSIIRSRDPKFLEPWLATADDLMRRNMREKKFPDMGLSPDEMVVNSNFRYDWANAVDFGYTDQCRFYTSWTGPSYLRIFRLNPKKEGEQWLKRDRNGSEVAFRIDKESKQVFLNAIQRDMNENFENVKK
jgi:hypothetical protein